MHDQHTLAQIASLLPSQNTPISDSTALVVAGKILEVSDGKLSQEQISDIFEVLDRLVDNPGAAVLNPARVSAVLGAVENILPQRTGKLTSQAKEIFERGVAVVEEIVDNSDLSLAQVRKGIEIMATVVNHQLSNRGESSALGAGYESRVDQLLRDLTLQNAKNLTTSEVTPGNPVRLESNGVGAMVFVPSREEEELDGGSFGFKLRLPRAVFSSAQRIMVTVNPLNPYQNLDKRSALSSIVHIDVLDFASSKMMKVSGLSRPIVITLKVNYGTLQPDMVALKYFDETQGTWSSAGVEDSVKDALGNTISAGVYHLTPFAAITGDAGVVSTGRSSGGGGGGGCILRKDKE